MATHLAIFLPSLDGGGAEKVMLALAGEFASRGINTDIVVAIPQGRLLNHVPATVNLVSLDHRKTISATFSLAQYLKQRKPRCLLSTVFSANIAALLASKLARVETRIVTCEASLTEWNVQTGRRFGTAINKLAANLLYREADAAIAISEDVRSSLVKFHHFSSTSIHLIPNPLPLPDTSPRVRSAKGSKAMVLACGRLEGPKDYPTLLSAFAILRKRLDVSLTILGEGSLLNSLVDQAIALGIRQDVTFAGFQPETYPYFHAASLFVHSARYEGFGIVLLEALACGCPIVATDCEGGVREILDHGKYGTLVPVADPNALAAAMEDMLKGRAQFDDPTQHLRKYSLETIADSYMQVLFPNGVQDGR